MKKILLTSAVALAVFSACSKMDYEGNDHEGTKVNVKADIKGMNTRLTDGTTWDSGDAIGVTGGNNNINIKRSYSADGETSWTGSEIYVLGSNSQTFTAYYPFTGEEGTDQGTITFSVVDKNNAYVGDEKVDYLWATATASKSNTTAEFEFEHKMSKIALTFSDGTDTRADETAQEVKYTLSNVITDGTFNTATGKVTAGSTKGTIVVTTAMGETSSVIVPSISSSSTTTDDNAITLKIETGGKAYQGTITPGLSESNQYNYTVTISSTTETNAITVSSSSVKGWTSNKAEAVTIEEIEVENTLEVGDFLLADGTVIDKSTTDFTDKTVVGVVYYVGNPQPSTLYSGTYTEAQDILKAEYSTATNGLAIAIKNAQTDAARFATSQFNYKTWIEAQTDFSSSYISDYMGVSTTPTHILGYNNTAIIEKAGTTGTYSETKNDKTTDYTSDGVSALLELLTSFRTSNAVTGASKWYLPSYAELKLIQDNYSTIKASVETAGGTLPQYTDYLYVSKGTSNNTAGTFYWTSDMRNASNGWVCPLADITTDGNLLYITRTSNASTGYFRFAIAF